MISDAYVTFTCDECGNEESRDLPVVYSSYAGRDPHADLRQSALDALLPRHWAQDGDNHYCEDCAIERRKTA
jgi:hypothetical protein